MRPRPSFKNVELFMVMATFISLSLSFFTGSGPGLGRGRLGFLIKTSRDSILSSLAKILVSNPKSVGLVSMLSSLAKVSIGAVLTTTLPFRIPFSCSLQRLQQTVAPADKHLKKRALDFCTMQQNANGSVWD